MRTPAEIQADEVMEVIEHLSTTDYYGHKEMLKHLYQMHNLRDERHWHEFNDYMEDVLNWTRVQRDEFWYPAIPMQTF